MIDKHKRSDRLHKSKVAALKQKRISKAHDLPDQPLHTYNKRHAMNCGNPNCVMCMNPRKAFNEPTMQEKKAAERDKIDSRDNR